MSTGKKRRGPPNKVTDEQQTGLRDAFKDVPRGKKLAFYAEHARLLKVHPLTIKRAVGGGGSGLSVAQKMELRREFKQVGTKFGAKGKFYRTHAQRLGVNTWTIRNAVMG
jgi:hypothetical protein